MESIDGANDSARYCWCKFCVGGEKQTAAQSKLIANHNRTRGTVGSAGVPPFGQIGAQCRQDLPYIPENRQKASINLGG
jgi:hypothetical protein